MYTAVADAQRMTDSLMKSIRDREQWVLRVSTSGIQHGTPNIPDEAQGGVGGPEPIGGLSCGS